MDPQRIALDAAKEAVAELEAGPNTALMYAAFGLLDAFIKMAEEKHIPVWEDLRAAHGTIQTLLEES